MLFIKRAHDEIFVYFKIEFIFIKLTTYKINLFIHCIIPNLAVLYWLIRILWFIFTQIHAHRISRIFLKVISSQYFDFISFIALKMATNFIL